MKISVTKKALSDAPKKYTRIIVTEEKKSWHRLVERSDGALEYRLGAGKYKEMTPRKFISFVRSIVQAAKSHQLDHVALELSQSLFPQLESYGEAWVVSTVVENLQLADYEFRQYKTDNKKNSIPLKEILLCGGLSKAGTAGFDRGMIVGEYVNKARDIANTPGDDMTPSQLAKAAKDIAKGTKLDVKVLDPAAIKKEGLHALWAVGKAGDDLPRFIVMEYWGAGKPTKNSTDKSKQPIVLVGKGITYDTGGLNVKPSGHMHDMHLDMSGGSSVMGAIAAAAKLGLKKNVIAIIPAAENAISEKAMRAGDIINSHAGKTIEVLHTDAEGRLVLADGLSYAKRYNPRVILDTATLTGAALVALGQHASAVLSEDNELTATLMEYGEESGDYVWPLPLWDEYKVPLTKTRADVANIQPGFSRMAGTIEGAAFLSFFAPKDVPWCHIDIAPRMESITSDKLAKGSTGEPMRLLVKFIEKFE
ncbi:leucyl aminopeptidase family protein [Candidatus Pacebacteria bacterium]|nr:leucyl aminopeptidase family protein [Candidatus Paceibacterota bacterium]